jgi:hypothetical protein
MFDFLHSIFRTGNNAGRPDDRLVGLATDRLLDGTEPRLRAASGCRRVLREPVTRAVEHVIALVESLPAPVELGAAQYAENPCLRAFFVSIAHLQETLSYCNDMQKFLRNPPPLAAGHIFGLLTGTRSEKGVLGMALEGDAVKRDVAQVVVNFGDYRLIGLAPDAEEMQRELKKRAFDHLIQCALQALTTARDTAERLTNRHRLLQRKLSALDSAGLGVGGFSSTAAAAAAAADSPEAIAANLAAIERELAELPADTATLEGQLATVAEALAQPEQLLRLERTSLTLDPMGVRLEGAAAAGVAPLELTELVSHERRRVALPGYVVRGQLLPPRDFLAEARRRLSGAR